MVIPLQLEAPLLGTPPPAVIKALHGLRWCIIAMYACVFFRIAQGDGMLPALSDLLPAVVGTHLLRDDPYFVHCYRCLHSVAAVGQGGLACLPSFMVLSGMNGALGLIRALSLSGDRAGGGFLQSLLLVSSLIYLATCAVCCWAWKAMQRNRGGLLDEAGLLADVEHGQYDHVADAQGAAMRRALELARRGAGAMAGATPLPAQGIDHQQGMSNESPDDAALRLAIQASMRSEGAGSAGTVEGEEDALLMAAIHQSQAAALEGRSADPEAQRVIQDSEAQEGRRLVEEQNAEFEESLAIDQAREMAEREAQEQARAEAQRLQTEHEQLQAAEAEKQRLEEERAASALRAVEEKRARLPPEPAAGEPGRKLLLFRLPSGRRCQRAFKASDLVGSLYDFVETEDMDMADNTYCLVVQVPRRRFDERDQTLEAAGVENQSVILAEVD